MDAHDDMDELEARIEALAASIERCRKISLAAKLIIAAGGAWLVMLLLGIVDFAPYALVASLAAIIGGIVLVGSNSTTWKQTEAALRRTEAARAALIDELRLRVIEDAPTLH